MSNRIKMIVGGICNLIVLVTFALILVVLSENRVVHLVLAASASGSLSELNANRVVLTTQDVGSFVGKQELVVPDDPNDVQRTFYAFKGIPYASPPIGELRWAPPEPVELKSTPHQASDFKPPCSQWSPIKKKVVGTPDCLYLNIYTSYIPISSKRRISGNQLPWTVENPNLLPVLVYIHGGEFISGSASKYSPDALMKRERVVLVTFNFRLGVLGFLSSGSDALSGNYGLMDQIAAMKWIQKYISRFGGNPMRVTVFGSVEYLLLANSAVISNNEDEAQVNNQELFHAAILKPQSTSILSPFTKVDGKEGAKNFLKYFADNVGCSGDASHARNDTILALIDCMKKADTDTLIRSQTKLQTFHNFPFPHTKSRPLGPVVDHFVLDDEPENLFASGKFHDVPLMVGLSANEGFNMFLEFYLKLYRKNVKYGGGAENHEDNKEQQNLANLTNILTEEDVKSLLRSILQTVMVATPDMEENGAFDRVFHSIWNYYFGGIKSDSWKAEIEQVILKLFRLLGDMFVNTGHCKLLQALSTHAKAPVYSYVFSHGSSNFAEFFKVTRNAYENSEGLLGPKRPKRSLHMTLDAPWDETYYLLHPIQDEDFPSTSKGNPLAVPEELADDDRIVLDAIAKIWVSFTKFAEPKHAIEELPDYGKWVKVEPGHRSFNYYLISNLSLQRGMRSDFRKAECQFWMSTVPQVRKLSKVIQELEPFPILFWSSVAVVVLFALIIITLIVLIVCVKQKTGSYGGDGIHLHNARHL